MENVVAHYIDGKENLGESDRSSNVYDPGTAQVTRSVVLGTSLDVDSAVASAHQAFATWGKTPLSQRARVMFAYREVLERNVTNIARVISNEHGKTLPDAIGEVRRGLEVVEFACGIPQLQKSQYSEGVSREVDTFSIRQPLGVVAGITPFNFPAMVPLWMIPVAIATGNTFILKPSEKDPSTSLLLASLFSEAGGPDGVFNVVQGDKTVVDALLDHSLVRAVSFVGSTPIARYIYGRASANGKRVQALGGAKNHMVVLPDADLEAAADAVVSAAYGSAGERCMAISALVLVGDIADKMIDLISDRIAKLHIGYGIDEGVDMGPLVTAEHRDRVASFIETARKDGARVVVDGRDHKVASEAGFYLGASLIDNVTPGMAVYDNEIFGPVLSCTRVADSNAALELINSNQFANGASIFTRSGSAARYFQSEVSAGMVGINVPIPVPVAYYSFGGYKDSLFGDTHVHGEEGVKFYTRGKVVTQRWVHESRRGVDFGFPQT
ncbi:MULTISPECIES: CoA-acylating methylmalonate-semialdehyde dehydrogenase [Acidithrix]|uniref:methylmalonate-semialdehyde dehydrogenase (CoA acylating) n=1 Tax=Acidithrix ferrooxidans TaxID=1280514 RepID=A0A0D8HJZ0_9ACTN|nr:MULTISPECIES: CoA-acylating methylmalonate-semialdehyde dehydrogenase [Acidithrix]KJF18067.1 putative 3-oxopropanoate dehydrogenase [Acidithrix ferrooxidans]CAG4930058.1 unnamed protein product [Acidithrix sp. C25]